MKNVSVLAVMVMISRKEDGPPHINDLHAHPCLLTGDSSGGS